MNSGLYYPHGPNIRVTLDDLTISGLHLAELYIGELASEDPVTRILGGINRGMQISEQMEPGIYTPIVELSWRNGRKPQHHVTYEFSVNETSFLDRVRENDWYLSFPTDDKGSYLINSFCSNYIQWFLASVNNTMPVLPLGDPPEEIMRSFGLFETFRLAKSPFITLEVDNVGDATNQFACSLKVSPYKHKPQISSPFWLETIEKSND